MLRWESWSGLATAHPAQDLAPVGVSEVSRRGRRRPPGRSPREDGRLRALVHRHRRHRRAAAAPDRLTGIRRRRPRGDDRHGAGRHPAARPQRPAARLGLALHNMGDIDRQTVAGAIATGTHGTGGAVGVAVRAGRRRWRSWPRDGEVVLARPTARPRRRRCSRRPGSGWVRSASSPRSPSGSSRRSRSRRSRRRCRWDGVVDGFDELADGNEHFEAYWFPHTDRMLTKRNNRARDGTPRPCPALRACVDDEFLSTRCSARSTASATSPARRSPGSTGSRRGRCRRGPTPTSRTGCSRRRAGWCSARWSTPCHARRHGRR